MAANDGIRVCWDCKLTTADWVLEARTTGGDQFSETHTMVAVHNDRRYCYSLQRRGNYALRLRGAQLLVNDYTYLLARAQRELSELQAEAQASNANDTGAHADAGRHDI